MNYDKLTHIKNESTGLISARYMDMEGFKYIEKTRHYLDYLEEHLTFVHKAFCELNDACKGKENWVNDDAEWMQIMNDVKYHDVSKFSKFEFTQYRDNFFPVNNYDLENSGFTEAVEHHKLNNKHHHESIGHYCDVVHMVIDWMAMAYKFNGCPIDYYNNNKESINISKCHEIYLIRLLDELKEYRNKK